MITKDDFGGKIKPQLELAKQLFEELLDSHQEVGNLFFSNETTQLKREVKGIKEVLENTVTNLIESKSTIKRMLSLIEESIEVSRKTLKSATDFYNAIPAQ